MKNPILRNGLVFAITVAVGYAACTVVFIAFPATAAAFLNTLFHGLDFGKLSADGGFSAANALSAGGILFAWAFLLACLYGLLRRGLAPRS